MRILLVNDDGFDSPLLHVLCRATAERGHEVLVSAPHMQQSAKSHAFTISGPLLVHPGRMEGAKEAWRVEGTPVDACRLGLLGLYEGPFDLVISGINAGYNIGLATYVSGTVGAAREAAFQHVLSMAVSLEPRTPEETVKRFASWCVQLGERLRDMDCPPMTLINVNAPPIPWNEIRGAKICPLNRHVYKDGYTRAISPRGTTYFWLSDEIEDMEPEADTDLDELHKGYLSLTFMGPEGYSDMQNRSLDLPSINGSSDL